MSDDANIYNGHRYGTAAAATQARRDAEEAQGRLEVGRQRRAADFERQVRDRFLATGGTDEQWNQEKPAILAEARKTAALAGDDAARIAHSRMYG